jgi:hypothetical protein
VRSRGSGAWSLSRRQLRHRGRELGAGKVVVGHGLGLATFYRVGRGGRRPVKGREVAAGGVIFNYQRLPKMGRGNEGAAPIRWGEEERI